MNTLSKVVYLVPMSIPNDRTETSYIKEVYENYCYKRSGAEIRLV